MSGDLLRRLFQLTRAHLADRTPLPPIGDGRSDGNPRAGATVDAQDERLAGYYANLEIPYGSDLHTVRAAWKQMMKKLTVWVYDSGISKGVSSRNRLITFSVIRATLLS